MYNQTAGWVRWTPPPAQHHNGNLYGYKIEVSAGNTMKVLANMTLNATTTSVLLNNLTTGAVYSVRLNSFTKAGDGPYSKPVRKCFCYLIYSEFSQLFSLEDLTVYGPKPPCPSAASPSQWHPRWSTRGSGCRLSQQWKLTHRQQQSHHPQKDHRLPVWTLANGPGFHYTPCGGHFHSYSHGLL